MPECQKPDFMRGTFAWTHCGYTFPGPPDVDLLAPQALESANHYVVLGAVLERLRQRDYSHTLAPFRSWMACGDADDAARCTIHLIADAGKPDDLKMLQKILQESPDGLRAYAAEGAALVGQLWLVPDMLSAWVHVASRGHHETIGFAISTVLEEPGGPIAETAGRYRVSQADRDEISRLLGRRYSRDASPEGETEFERRVKSRLAELRTQFRDDDLLWEGKPFEIEPFVSKMYDDLQLRDPSFIVRRHKFEAFTGYDCSGFFKKGEIQRLSVAATLEAILESGDLAHYEPNARYFLGHRIPD